MLRIIRAELFHHELNAGRTRPVILGCQNDDGSSAGEFVVKLRSEVEAQGGNSCFEVFGILLAQHFDIATPEAVLVQIDSEMGKAVPPGAWPCRRPDQEERGPQFRHQVPARLSNVAARSGHSRLAAFRGTRPFRLRCSNSESGSGRGQTEPADGERQNPGNRSRFSFFFCPRFGRPGRPLRPASVAVFRKTRLLFPDQG